MSAKIAYLIARFPVASETFVAAEIQRLTQRGVGLEIFSFSRPAPEEVQYLGATSRRLLAATCYVGGGELLLAALRNPWGLIGAYRENRRLQQASTLKPSSLARVLRAVAVAHRMKTAGIRHLHAHWPYATQVAHLVRTISGCSFSVSIHAHEVAHENGHFPVVFPGLSFAAFCNRGAMEYLLSRTAANERSRAHLIYHGVDLADFRPLPLPDSAWPMSVITAGRLTPTKGFDRLIRGCAAARQQGLDVRLTILGRGAIEGELRALAADLDFSEFLNMPGWVPHDEVRKYMHSAHVFALLADTSFHDGLPNVVLEAMASGRPVILSPLPAAPEVVSHGVEGFVLGDAADSAGLIEALRRLQTEPGLLQKLGDAARRRVEADHDAEVQIERMAELFGRYADARISQLPTMSYVVKPDRATLGVVAIAKDEERDLQGFLRHLLPWVDEIVIVDDGSTDRTREIARAAGGKVRLVEQRMTREGGFAHQRNTGIEAASAHWLLHMDIDERVPPDLAAEILGVLQDERYNAYRYRRLNFFLHRPMTAGGWQHWNNPQLARRGVHRFRNAVHEQCAIEGGERATGQLAAYMWHLNDEDFVERVGKNLRYMQMTGDELIARGLTVRWYHLLFMPAYRALRSYLLDGGFRLGTRGLLFGIYTFTSTFNWYAYAWDRQNRIARADLEAALEQKWSESARRDSDRESATGDPVASQGRPS